MRGTVKNSVAHLGSMIQQSKYFELKRSLWQAGSLCCPDWAYSESARDHAHRQCQWAAAHRRSPSTYSAGPPTRVLAGTQPSRRARTRPEGRALRVGGRHEPQSMNFHWASRAQLQCKQPNGTFMSSLSPIGESYTIVAARLCTDRRARATVRAPHFGDTDNQPLQGQRSEGQRNWQRPGQRRSKRS